MSNSKRKTLGRGLSALLGDEADVEEIATGGSSGIQTIPIEFLHPGEYQPRHAMDSVAIAELAASISQKGVLQPLLVRPHPDRDNEYEIIAGERRWRASQEAQLHEVPVIVRDFTDAEALEVGLVENLQRQDLSPIEEADGYQRLIEEFGHTQEMMTNVVGKSRSHIANTLRLLRLPEVIKLMIEDGKLSAGHARALLGIDDPLSVANKIVKDGLNVRQAEKLVTSKAKEKSVPASAKPAPDMKDADTLALERNMTALLGLQVDISSRSSGGALVIHYKTLDQLDDVLHRLSNGPRGASSIPADSADISFSNDMSDLNEIFDESMDDIIADTEPEPDQDSMSSAEDSLDDAFDEQDPVEDGDLMIGDQSDSDDEMLGLEDDDLEGEGFEDVVSENNTLSESMSAISKIIGDDASTADLAEDGSITASMDSISKLLGEESESSDTSDEDETGDDLESVPDSDTTDDNADEKEIRIKDLID